MIAIDTNILVYAHREESPWHAEAVAALRRAAAGSWAIPWPCVHEFLSIVTHPKIFDPPTPLADALASVRAWQGSRTLRFLGEPGDYAGVLDEVLTKSRVVGPKIHDARIAALCVAHGVVELWSADRDFSRFTGLKITNPLIAVPVA